MDAVNGSNRRVGVRVSGQQGAFGLRVKLHGFLQELHPGHARHSLVHKKQRHRFVAQFQLLYSFQGGRA